MTKQKFLKDIRKIYASGNLESAYDLMLNIISEKGLDFEEVLIDYTYILNKYKSYCLSWDKSYGEKKKKGFLPKDVSKMEIAQYLAQAEYKRDHDLREHNVSRDKYLFGDKLEEMHGKLRKIQESIETQKTKITT